MKKFFSFLKKTFGKRDTQPSSFVPAALRPSNVKTTRETETPAQEKRPEKPSKPEPVSEQKPVSKPQAKSQKYPAQSSKPQTKWTPNDFQVAPQEGKTRFHDLDLPWSVMHGIADLKFEYCTPIQASLLAHTLKGKDATAKAQTGTGKTASFILTILNAFIKKPVKNKNGCPRALILAPTRELVYQIEKDFKDLARYTPIRIIAIYGGTGYKNQQQELTAKPVDVIVATPGRLIDFMSKRLIDPSRVEIMIIDEADRMLDMGFIPDVRKIVQKTPHKDKRQTLFFSATLTEDVLRLAESWTAADAVQIEMSPDHSAAESIEQIVYISTEADKFKHVFNLINNEKLERVILFVNRKDTARTLSEKLERYGQKCSVLSGDIAQDRRFKVLDNFKNGRINILVATDVAARGLHIENISHVINYDLPHEPEHYIHRIGRTGRAGASGISVSFADEMSSFFIPKIEEVLGNKIICEYPSEELEQELPTPKPKKKQPPKSSFIKRKPFKGKDRQPDRGSRPQ
ncbi:MAG: DEAD/DEAH box helicase [Pseudomonadota bacterium]